MYKTQNHGSSKAHYIIKLDGIILVQVESCNYLDVVIEENGKIEK